MTFVLTARAVQPGIAAVDQLGRFAPSVASLPRSLRSLGGSPLNAKVVSQTNADSPRWG